MAQLHLTVSPDAKSSSLDALPKGAIRVRIAAPAREGRANQALLRFIAERLSVPSSHVRLIRGARSRHKVVEVDGLAAEDARLRLLQ